MPRKMLRGRLLSFRRRPQSNQDEAAFDYIEDGALIVEDGHILASDTYDALVVQYPQMPTIDHRPHLIMPGFIDLHLHFPQIQVVASWGAQLLEWLENHTFPQEMRFAEIEHAQRMASAFFDILTAHGTTTAVAFCTSHPNSVDAFFNEAYKRNMRMFGGKVMMDRGAPAALLDTAQIGYDQSKALIGRWHGTGRLGYVISPRFALTSTPDQLRASGTLIQEHPDCFLQTHLSENLAEVEAVKQLFPKARDYLDIYQHFGLVGTQSLLGHAIHLTPREIDALAQTGAVPVFCPSSNLFLGSGLFNDRALRDHGILPGIASDIGGGTSYAMLSTLGDGYKILQLQGQTLNPLQAFDWITRGNAEILGLSDKIGTLALGSEADLVVLNAHATAAMSLRMETAQTLADELFVLQILGDERAIEGTYVMGELCKTPIPLTA